MSQAPPPPRPRPADPMAAAQRDAAMRERISAYPGTLTYIDLIRKNKRQSAMLIAVMIALGGLIGGVFGSAFALYTGASGDSLVPSAVTGLVAALAAGSMASAWAWFGGSSAILSMAGAQRITKPMDPELFNVVEEVSIAAGLPVPQVYLIGDTAMNAFATGRDPQHAAVAITVGLRQKLTRDELQAVMAHEVAHIRHYDIRFAMLMATMVGLIAFACDALLRVAYHSMWGGRRWSNQREHQGHPFIAVGLMALAVILAVVAPFAAFAIQMAYSRQREYLADAGAVELTRNPLALAGALQKLADDPDPLVDVANRGTAHLYIVNPLRKMRESGQRLNSLFTSHPPVKDRIARLLALAR